MLSRSISKIALFSALVFLPVSSIAQANKESSYFIPSFQQDSNTATPQSEDMQEEFVIEAADQSLVGMWSGKIIDDKPITFTFFPSKAMLTVVTENSDDSTDDVLVGYYSKSDEDNLFEISLYLTGSDAQGLGAVVPLRGQLEIVEIEEKRLTISLTTANIGSSGTSTTIYELNRVEPEESNISVNDIVGLWQPEIGTGILTFAENGDFSLVDAQGEIEGAYSFQNDLIDVILLVPLNSDTGSLFGVTIPFLITRFGPIKVISVTSNELTIQMDSQVDAVTLHRK